MKESTEKGVLQGNKRKIEYRNEKAISRVTCKKKEQAKQCTLTGTIPYILIPYILILTSDWQENKIKIESDKEIKAVGRVTTTSERKDEPNSADLQFEYQPQQNPCKKS